MVDKHEFQADTSEPSNQAGDQVGTVEIPHEPRPGMRFVGYSIKENNFIELNPDLSCPADPDHPKSSIGMVLELHQNDELPRMPRFNLGAALVPPIWGFAHGMKFMMMYLLVWFFIYNLVSLSIKGHMGWASSIGVIAVSALFQIYYGATVNTPAYLRVASQVSPQTFLSGEKKWSIIGLVCFTLLVMLMGTGWFFTSGAAL